MVLYVHGGHSSCQETFGIAALAEAGWTVLVPSRPGYGGTPLRTGGDAEATADALAALLDGCGIDRVAVYGVSAGGPTALHLCARHPQRISHLVLACAVTRLWIAEDDPMYRTAHRIFGRAQALVWGSLRAMAAVAPRRTARMMLAPLTRLDVDEVAAQLDAHDIAEICAMIRRQASGEGFLRDVHHRVEPEVLERITAPTLVVHSRHDASVPFDHAVHACAHIPGARLFEAPTPSHLVWIGPGSRAVDDEIVSFLSGGPAGTG